MDFPSGKRSDRASEFPNGADEQPNRKTKEAKRGQAQGFKQKEKVEGLGRESVPLLNAYSHYMMRRIVYAIGFVLWLGSGNCGRGHNDRCGDRERKEERPMTQNTRTEELTLYVFYRDGKVWRYSDGSPAVCETMEAAKYRIQMAAAYLAPQEYFANNKRHFDDLPDEDQDALYREQEARFSIVEFVPNEVSSEIERLERLITEIHFKATTTLENPLDLLLQIQNLIESGGRSKYPLVHIRKGRRC